MTRAPRPTILVRADASQEIGTGHVMRCLALAQAWQDRKGRAVFLCAAGADAVLERVRQQGCEVRLLASQRTTHSDADETAALARELGAAWTVLDGYDFSSAYRCRLSAAGPLLWIDDLGTSDQICARAVLNTEIAASPTMYPQRSQDDCNLLLGPKYFLMRSEFLRARSNVRGPSPVVRNILVTLGGADAANVTADVLHALGAAALPDVTISVVVGPANSREEFLRSAAAHVGGRVDVISNGDMPTLMTSADMAISAGGVTSRELAFMGVPQIVMELASNQAGNVRGLTAHNAAIQAPLPDSQSAGKLVAIIHTLAGDATLRSRLRANGQALVDGQGAHRVVDFLLADS